ALGLRIRPLAHAAFDGSGTAWAAPAAVPVSHPLAAVEEAGNGVLLAGEPFGELFFARPGAGAAPTASAVVDALVAVAQGVRATSAARASWLRRRDAAPVTADRWFVALAPAPGGPGPDRLLAHVAEAGLVFVELRALEESGGRVLAGVTAEAEAS